MDKEDETVIEEIRKRKRKREKEKEIDTQIL